MRGKAKAGVPLRYNGEPFERAGKICHRCHERLAYRAKAKRAAEMFGPYSAKPLTPEDVARNAAIVRAGWVKAKAMPLADDGRTERRQREMADRAASERRTAAESRRQQIRRLGVPGTIRPMGV